MHFPANGNTSTCLCARKTRSLRSRTVPAGIPGTYLRPMRPTFLGANSMTSESSGLAKHFKDGGCPKPNEPGREKENLTVTLVDHLDTTQEEIDAANHTGGVQCKCTICGKLKTLEDKFIVKTGSFYTHGLNSRDEIRKKSRCQW